MAALFADSGYWIALIDSRDQLHSRARAVSARLNDAEIVTTQMALVETLASQAGSGERARLAATRLVERLVQSPRVEIIPQTDAQFQAAFERYAARPDQRWSLTDCASFIVMEERGVSEALAYDRDFEQAGFTALLRHETL
ncbi:MAG: PIN domain-containing protein [Chloroflexi bacterium]|nr:PIN domain-containing protein [Chloroflexota bacterium]MCY3587899.1 PIN domain-containing protein [Chloroflexota bacterium]MCY3684816.1 PIN domain-containing protein [Chloroflexota bacterium]MDE2708646.1 PIN domain-containing protein [Chloroflexota bacterium]